MAMTVYGVEADLDVTEWAEYMEAHSLVAPSPDGVLSGVVASVATGDRRVAVSGGKAVAPGVLIDVTVSESVFLDANTSGNPRIDVIVLEVDWSGSATTAGDMKAVKGSPAASPVAPTLTRTPGSVWQIPLAYVTVANGATQLVAANITTTQSGSAYQSLTLAAGYTQVSNNPLAVAISNGMVEFSGAFRRSGSNVTVGSAVSLCTIPQGYRPRRDHGFATSVDLSGTTTIAGVFVDTSGQVKLHPATGTINDGDVIRILQTWLPEV